MTKFVLLQQLKPQGLPLTRVKNRFWGETTVKIKNSIAVATIVLAAAFLQLMPSTAQAANIRLGLLTCDVDAGTGFLIGSKKDLECVFTPASQDQPDEWYFGTVTKFGLDIGKTKVTILKWVVLGIDIDSLPHGALAGKYAGVSASGSLGVGLGVNALIGGSRNGFILQPFSLEGTVGFNLAVGLTGITLKAGD